MIDFFIYGAIGTLWSLVSMLFWSRIRRIEKDIEMNNKRCSEIEKNYLSRFEQMNNSINSVKEQNTYEHNQIEKTITQRITEIEKSIIRELAKNG